MTTGPLSWLPPHSSWPLALAALPVTPSPEAWQVLVELANHRLDLISTLQLDRRLQKVFPMPPGKLASRPVRVAVLGSCTIDHLLPGIRVAGLRRGLHVTTLTADYGQYVEPLLVPDSALWLQKPDVILLGLDARHIANGVLPSASAAEAEAHLDRLFARLGALWQTASNMGVAVIQQTAMPIFPSLLGEAEHQMPGAPMTLISAFNERLRREAGGAGVLVLSIDRHVCEDGLSAWHDPTLWYRAKQEIHPAMAPMYGELLGRILAARQGRSAKCLVLDLDNTVWGGVIGDDGVEGIVLGQGSALGEAYIAFQQYAKALSQRGVILAVCSKNDEANAIAGFDDHPEMVLRRSDIACFVANWLDKAHNLRVIAETLNIGIESLVFADDNPAERAIIRRELPMVAVPELPEDPAHYASIIAASGYFEALALTGEDRERSGQYQQNMRRAQLASSVTDMEGYLRALEMVGRWSSFQSVDRARVVQLINKTNQFNLTTRRYTDAEIQTAMADPSVGTLQLRLLDQFGDNGIIGLAILRPVDGAERTLEVDTWLMSCRVLKRGVEGAMLNLLVEQADALGARTLRGRYQPTAKNGMVADHYAQLGFASIGTQGDETLWQLNLDAFKPAIHNIDLVETREATPA